MMAISAAEASQLVPGHKLWFCTANERSEAVVKRRLPNRPDRIELDVIRVGPVPDREVWSATRNRVMTDNGPLKGSGEWLEHHV